MIEPFEMAVVHFHKIKVVSPQRKPGGSWVHYPLKYLPRSPPS